MEYPTIEAVKSKLGHQLEFYCTYCRKWHFHGRGDGHRVAHCFKPDSPYKRHGYVLKEVQTTRTMLKTKTMSRGHAHTDGELPEKGLHAQHTRRKNCR
jgi:hypothetical protein